MAKLTLMARGAFKSHLAEHMEHQEFHYAHFEEGEEVNTTITKMPTQRMSENLSEALNIQLTNLRTHTNIDVSSVVKAGLKRAGLTDEEMHSFFVLRKAGFTFFALLDA